jgi:hypothetical protein
MRHTYQNHFNEQRANQSADVRNSVFKGFVALNAPKSLQTRDKIILVYPDLDRMAVQKKAAIAAAHNI